MPTPKIKLKPCKILIQPTADTSSFSTEVKKYDRKSVGIVCGVYDFCSIKPGEKVIYDDSKAIDFSIDGTSYQIVNVDDIAAFIEEEA